MVGQQQETASGSSEPKFTTGTYMMYDGTTDDEAPWMGDWDGMRLTGNCKPKVPVTVEVEDIRSMSVKPSMKKEGHQLVYAPTTLTREQFLTTPTPEGDKLIKSTYFDECARIIKETTGADKVTVFAFGFRIEPDNRAPEESYSMVKKMNDVRGITNFAHVDRDPETAHIQIREQLGDDQHDKIFSKYKTVHNVNMWRPIGNPVERSPLLIIKTDNVSDFSYENNFAWVEQRNSRGTTKSRQPMLLPHPDYKHAFISKLKPEECLIFRDTDLTGNLRAQPHSAFWDHNTRADAPMRESIEVRAMIFYEKEWPACVEGVDS